MNRYAEIKSAYRALGEEATFYDGMITCSTLPGKAVCRLVWAMGQVETHDYLSRALFCGLLGCVCFGVGDWLMIYGDTTCSGTISWLTRGATQIAPWRNNLAMGLAFPGILLYGIALFAIGNLLKEDWRQRVYHYLTALFAVSKKQVGMENENPIDRAYMEDFFAWVYGRYT